MLGVEHSKRSEEKGDIPFATYLVRVTERLLTRRKRQSAHALCAKNKMKKATSTAAKARFSRQQGLRRRRGMARY